MDHIDEAYRNKIATLLRAMCAAKYAKEDNLPCQIAEDVFLGSVGVASNKDALKNLDVTHILIVARSLEPAYPNDFIYKKIEVLDSPDTNLEQHFDECFNFIDEAKRLGGRVLVHCFAGKSRSVTIVVAYLMKKYHKSLSQALDLVRSKRPQMAPNQGFMLQLRNFESSLRGQHGSNGTVIAISSPSDVDFA
ncbi:hypothetical protein AAC387_Pa10g1218 [Persea americana]|eukprot:TRINITY_DN528_c0_g2_i5.p1 TRINITY_DN528_c0_g2~~TRINITY_DN528_c0_g2_i5.p1  ORF type:complete len:192 (-),score=32.50 TRINITY_DN528_c0_g2_i5:270-845(-)